VAGGDQCGALFVVIFSLLIFNSMILYRDCMQAFTASPTTVYLLHTFYPDDDEIGKVISAAKEDDWTGE
jgi:hypothetical protein